MSGNLWWLGRQRWIQDFQDGGGGHQSQRGGGNNLLFGQISPKTAWKLRKLDQWRIRNFTATTFCEFTRAVFHETNSYSQNMYLWKNISFSQRYKIYFWLGQWVKFGFFFVYTIFIQENHSIKMAPNYFSLPSWLKYWNTVTRKMVFCFMKHNPYF